MAGLVQEELRSAWREVAHIAWIHVRTEKRNFEVSVGAGRRTSNALPVQLARCVHTTQNTMATPLHLATLTSFEDTPE
jgi:hypothetical protein